MKSMTSSTDSLTPKFKMKSVNQHAIQLAVLTLLAVHTSSHAQTSTASIPLTIDNSRAAHPSVLAPQGFTAATAQIATIDIQASRNNVPANGRDTIELKIQLLDSNRAPIVGDASITLETNRGRFVGLEAIDALSAAVDHEHAVSGNQIMVKDGYAVVRLQAPSEPGNTTVKVTAGPRQAQLDLSFVPDLRDMIAVGLVEGIINFSKSKGATLQAVRPSDGFERELRSLSHRFDQGKAAAGGRVAFFLKGRIQGQTLLTAAYDSDKDVRDRMFRDIRPDEFYPVYGDASVVSFDAQSTSRLYVRLDQGKNYLLWGDFNTSDAFATAQQSSDTVVLGRYSRSLTGLQGQWQGGGQAGDLVNVRAFVSKDSLRQVVDELPARGISGPYGLKYTNGIAGSERVELVVRDRNAPSVILQVTRMVQYVDYDFEPFSGRLLFKSPIPSLDANLNPISIRIAYEVESGGEEFWVYGAEGKLQINPSVSLGATYAKDRNPLGHYELASVNAKLRVAEKTQIVGELARSENDNVANFGFDQSLIGGSNSNITANAASGNAYRLDVRHDGDTLQARVYGQKTEKGFNNASSSSGIGYGNARTELGAKATYAARPGLRLTAEALSSKDDITDGEKKGAYVGGAYDVNPQVTIDLGVRRSTQSGAGATVPAVGAVYGLPTTSINPSTGGTLLDPTAVVTQANEPYSTTSVKGKVTIRPTDRTSVFVEGERALSQNEHDQYGHALAVGGDYRFSDIGRVYARAEKATGLGGDYGLNGGNTSQSALVVGVDTQYMKDGQLFSEYRLRDAINGQQAVAALGVRNVWKIADGLRLNTAVERVKVLDGDAPSGRAVALGLDYVGSDLWKGSTRLEWRQDQANNVSHTSTTSWLHTVAVARKLDDNWTLLAKNIYLQKKSSPWLNTDTHDDRFQIGAAWRPVDNNRWATLSRYEYWLQKDQAIPQDIRKHIVSTDLTYHPNRQWWVTAKVAGKWSQARLACITDPVTGTSSNCVNDKTSMQLLQMRVIKDLTPRWDISVIGNVLGESGFKNRNYGIGAEVGYLVTSNLWLSAGYNFRGVKDKDLLTDYSQRGAYIRLRFKFDENLFKGGQATIDKSVTPTSAP